MKLLQWLYIPLFPRATQEVIIENIHHYRRILAMYRPQAGDTLASSRMLIGKPVNLPVHAHPCRNGRLQFLQLPVADQIAQEISEHKLFMRTRQSKMR